MCHFRYAVVLLLIALLAPSAAAALAVGPRESTGVAGVVAAAPAEYTLSDIEFALERGDNATPVDPSTRFAFGPRTVWAFFSYSNAQPGDRLRWVLRFAGTDVAWGEEVLDQRSGRMELELRRADGDYLMIGTFTLTLDAQGSGSGDVRSASFDIYDPDANRNENHNDNNRNENHNDNV